MKEKRIFSIVSLVVLICLLFSTFYVFFGISHAHTCEKEHCPTCEFLAESKKSDTLIPSFIFVFITLFILFILNTLVRTFFAPKNSLIKLKVKLSS